jgi:pimeloyl-ACP methyl ester carboxylesterase
MATKETEGNYVNVNGLNLYYEMHGSGHPLVLLHGAFSAVGTSFAKVLPELARKQQVIAFELQGHGHTADVDRPLTMEQMADDVVAALRQLGIEKADIFGYSMGAGAALQVAIRHPELVSKLVLASVSYKLDGLHPGFMDGMAQMQPEMLVGSPWHDEYMRLNPRPENFNTLFAKVMQMDRELKDLPDSAISGITAPTLIIMGDSDIVRPEHGVEMFRLLGGGVMGDMVGLPNAQLAILPGTGHALLMERDDLLLPILHAFLNPPTPPTTP